VNWLVLVGASKTTRGNPNEAASGSASWGQRRPSLVEQADPAGALARLDHQLDCPGVQPAVAVRDQGLDRLPGKRSAVLGTELELQLEAAFAGHPHHRRRIDGDVGEPLASLDVSEPYVGAEVEVGMQPSLAQGHLERAAAGDGGHAADAHGGQLAAAHRLVGHHPAGHGELQGRHEVGALLQMALQDAEVVAGTERAGAGWQGRHADVAQVGGAVGARAGHRDRLSPWTLPAGASMAEDICRRVSV
jgi:hypothetical protein